MSSPPPTRKVRAARLRRRRRRRPGPGVACQLHSGGTTAAATLLNLAEGGACVGLPLPLAAGDRLTVLLCNRACLGSLTAGPALPGPRRPSRRSAPACASTAP
jgi:hypothetical protein